jgi:hypothetical protein
MKKIVLSLAALAAVSSVALADSAYDKQMKRNMIENPENYSFPNTIVGGGNGTGSYVSGDALAVESFDAGSYGSNGLIFGNKKFVGPGEDGRQAR